MACKITPQQTHWPWFIHGMTDNVSIVHVQGHIYAMKIPSSMEVLLRNAEVCYLSSHHLHPVGSVRGLALKEGWSNSINVIVCMSTWCICQACTMIDWPIRSIVTVSKGYTLSVSTVYINVIAHRVANLYSIHTCKYADNKLSCSATSVLLHLRHYIPHTHAFLWLESAKTNILKYHRTKIH